MEKYLNRMKKLNWAGENAAYLLAKPSSLKYYCGFRGDETYLLVINNTCYLLSDDRYKIQIAEECPFCHYARRTKETLMELAINLAKENGVKTLAIEENVVSAKEYQLLLESGLEVKFAENEFYSPRAVKSDDEVALVRQACYIANTALKNVESFFKVGAKEKDVARKLEDEMMRLGAEDLSFATIMAAGENGAKAHAIPGERAFQRGDLVVCDFGCKFRGYCSDTTRTFAIGEVSKECEEAYNLVLKAQVESENMVRPGILPKDLHNNAVKVFANEGQESFFTHSLGHGVGLDIHEEPYVNSRNEKPLIAGNIITIEPGLYYENKFGIRIEDTVVVTENGFEVLTLYPKELKILG